MLLIGRERKGQIEKIPGQSPDKSGKSRENLGKSQIDNKKDKSGWTSPDREASPRFETPRLAALEVRIPFALKGLSGFHKRGLLNSVSRLPLGTKLLHIIF